MLLPTRAGSLLLAQGWPEASWADMVVLALSASNMNPDCITSSQMHWSPLSQQREPRRVLPVRHCIRLGLERAVAAALLAVAAPGQPSAVSGQEPTAIKKLCAPLATDHLLVRKTCLRRERPDLLKDVTVNGYLRLLLLLLLHCSYQSLELHGHHILSSSPIVQGEAPSPTGE